MSSGADTFTILGCGSSGGVPRLGGDWGQCNPENPKNRRMRCAALVEKRTAQGTTSVLIDTGPDVREQLLSVRARCLDGVLFTHDHADHTHGIDDLRVMSYLMKRRIDAWCDAPTRESLLSRFAYCFQTPPGRNYPPILNAHHVEPGTPITVSGSGGPVTTMPVAQQHGNIQTIAYRFGNLAYSPDVSGLTPDAVAALQGLDVWIVDALRYTPHPAHFTVKQALDWIARLRPRRAILTHLHVDLDYDALRRELPDHVEPAYDGMVIPFDASAAPR